MRTEYFDRIVALIVLLSTLNIQKVLAQTGPSSPNLLRDSISEKAIFSYLKAVGTRSAVLSTNLPGPLQRFVFKFSIIPHDPDEYPSNILAIADGPSRVAIFGQTLERLPVYYWTADHAIALSAKSPGLFCRQSGGNPITEIRFSSTGTLDMHSKYEPIAQSPSTVLDLSGLIQGYLGNIVSATFDDPAQILHFRTPITAGAIELFKAESGIVFPIKAFAAENKYGTMQITVEDVGNLSAENLAILHNAADLKRGETLLGMDIDPVTPETDLFPANLEDDYRVVKAATELGALVFGGPLAAEASPKHVVSSMTQPDRSDRAQKDLESLKSVLRKAGPLEYSTKTSSRTNDFGFWVEDLINTGIGVTKTRYFVTRHNDRAAVVVTDINHSVLSYNTDGFCLAVDRANPGGLILVRNCSPSIYLEVGAAPTAGIALFGIHEFQKSARIDFRFGDWIQHLLTGVQWIAFDPEANLYTMHNVEETWQVQPWQSGAPSQYPFHAVKFLSTSTFPKSVVTIIFDPNALGGAIGFPETSPDSLVSLAIPIREVKSPAKNDAEMYLSPDELTDPNELEASEKLKAFVVTRTPSTSTSIIDK